MVCRWAWGVGGGHGVWCVGMKGMNVVWCGMCRNRMWHKYFVEEDCITLHCTFIIKYR